MKKILFVILSVLVLVGCANRGIGPQGGPKDSIPPMPVKSTPENGSVQFSGKRIEVQFNEYIQLNNVAQNLLMSPPQQTPPDVRARGKRLMVNFVDTLRDSTTYTIDFGDAVCDYTEKNPLHGFAFAFSTGDVIDTLEARGKVYNAEDLNVVSGVLVGIHSDLSDTAFTKHPFLRIARTDSAGNFRIGNMREGKYRLYAVEDISRDYRLTPGESYAFAEDYLIMKAPQPLAITLPDSTQQDSIVIDSIAQTATIVPPLFLFKEKQQKLYLQRTLREQQHLIKILFSASPDSLPILRPLSDSLHYITHYSARGDTVSLWLTDSTSIARDSIFIEAQYRRTDSLFRLEWFTDTLRAIWREPKLTAKAREALERQNRNRRLDIKTNARKGFEMYDTLKLSFATPLATISLDSIHLYQRIDTSLKAIPFTFAPYDTMPMKLCVMADFEPGKTYELKMDSGAMHDIYGITHIAASYQFQLKTPEDYSTLRVKLTPFEPLARIQLLSNKDKVLRELPAAEEGAYFEYLKPDTYYLRLYLDENGDGQWSVGDWKTQRQPEPVYYYPEKIQTKSNWDFEEEWDYLVVPQIESKPKALQAAPKK